MFILLCYVFLGHPGLVIQVQIPTNPYKPIQTQVNPPYLDLPATSRGNECSLVSRHLPTAILAISSPYANHTVGQAALAPGI